MNLKNPKYNPFFVKDYFLFEYSAIDKNTRARFRTKLLKRKGAEEQKNVKLIDMLEEIVNEDDFNEKHYAELSKKLGISKRILDCHKSRLLKSLREHAFNWKNIKGESEINKIRRRFAAGMLREARIELFLLEKKLKKEKIPQKKLPDLFEIHERSVQLYNYLKDKRRSSRSFKLAAGYYRSICKSKLNEDIKVNIKIRYDLLLSVKLMANRFKEENLKRSLDILEKILKIHGNNLKPEPAFKIFHRMGLLYNVLKFRDDSIKAFEEGRKLAGKYGLKADEIVFESFIFLRKFSENNKLAFKALQFHRDNFRFISENFTDIQQLMDFQFNYLRFLIYAGGEETEMITEDFVSKQILYSRKAEALNSWYLELSDQLSSSIYIMKKNNNGFEIIINRKILDEFSLINRLSVSRFSGLFMPNSLVILYVNLAEQEFWKHKDADFEMAENFIKKTARIMKLHYINISSSWIESTRLGIKIFEMLVSEKSVKVYRKYRNSLLKFIDTIKSDKQTFNISSDFAKLIFIAGILKIEELDKKIAELSQWISENNPEIFSIIQNSA